MSNNTNPNEGKQEDDNEYPTNSLHETIETLQEDLHMKEIARMNVTKEKDRLLDELKKSKVTIANLKQQLEDERAFYLKEKEYYCREMSLTKKNRQKQNQDVEDVSKYAKENEDLKKEITKLKSVVNETLEANYNLSVKFVRMKNTKYSLKARLKQEQTESCKIISELSIKLENARNELMYISNEKFKLPMAASNKKYLQILKQNTQLTHENLNYQIQLSKAHNELQRLKAQKIKKENNAQLQYVKRSNCHRAESSDKICEANLCQECKSNPISIMKISSDSTVSSVDFNSDTEISSRQIDVVRTHSTPDVRQSIADELSNRSF